MGLSITCKQTRNLTAVGMGQCDAQTRLQRESDHTVFDEKKKKSYLLREVNSRASLARTGMVDCRRPCASFPPSLGYTAMSILCVVRWRSARGMIEWICTQERWNPEVAIIFGAAARYRRATVGSSHDDAHPDNSTLHTGAVRPHTGFVGSLFFISPRMGHGCS